MLKMRQGESVLAGICRQCYGSVGHDAFIFRALKTSCFSELSDKLSSDVKIVEFPMKVMTSLIIP